MAKDKFKAGKVKRVIDGDTVELANGKKIRLANVHAPELGSASGTRAKNALKKLVDGKNVRTRKVGRSYDREVAYMKQSDGKSVNKAMRDKGYKK